jgi:leucyl aminopeptidase
LETRAVEGSITEVESDALIVNLFEGVTSPGGATGAVDRALGGMISDLIGSKETTGKLMETTLIHTQGKIAPKRVLVMGLGKSGDFDLIASRKVSAAAVRFLSKKGARTVTSIVHGAGIGGFDTREAARAVVEGTIFGLYRGDIYKKPEDERTEIESFTIVERDAGKIPDIEAAIQEGQILAEATNYARDLGNEPANKMKPVILAEKARETAERYGLEFEELDEERMAELGMDALLSVARGSGQPPRLIVMRYHAGDDKPMIGFVGKGLTFDSGGISIKPQEYLPTMKFDMAGGAAVIGAMGAIAQLKPGVNIVGVVPAAENMPGGCAYRPGDVVRCSNGKTVEIITTDAEGRMILSDALTYALKQGAKYVVDVATLTGSCAIALGSDITGIMGNKPEFLGDIKEAARLAGERVWELPLPPDYKEQLKSSIADLKNIGSRYGGAITGGLFLQEFVEDVPWVHMDIAGTANTPRDDGVSTDAYTAPGATGVGVRTLVLLAMQLARSR